MTAIQTYIQKNKQRFLDELFKFLRIPSISTKSEFKKEIIKAAEFLSDDLKKIGLENVKLYFENYPVVYGEKIIDKDLPTVLVYGHYDVQPSEPNNLWYSKPFEPEIRNEKIYARGASDDKGQMYMHLKAFEAMINTNSLPCNIKFVIEGEEESGSKKIRKFIREYKEKIKADVILISDTALINNQTPCITTGLRGIVYMEVQLTGSNRDLHSGVYGGAVPNPINILSKIITSLKDEKNKITIPNFYDDVKELSLQERSTIAKIPFDINKYKRELDLNLFEGEEGYIILERASIRPTLDVNGIWGGYTEEGSKTIIPSKCSAKISMRLVPDQSPEKIAELFEDHIQKITPKGMKVKIVQHDLGKPYSVSINSIGYRAANNAYKESFGKEAIPMKIGGSIPIVADFKKVLGLDSIMMGFGLDSDNIHSPDEHFGIFNYMKGIETIPLFYKHFTELTFQNP